MKIKELQDRAKDLREQYQEDSITPEMVGGLMADSLEYMAGMERNLSVIGVKKVYNSVAEMLADEDPQTDEGKPMRFGQLASAEGKFWRYVKPGDWTELDLDIPVLDEDMEDWLLSRMTGLSVTADKTLVEYGNRTEVTVTARTTYNDTAYGADALEVTAGAEAQRVETVGTGVYKSAVAVSADTTVSVKAVIKEYARSGSVEVKAYYKTYYGAYAAETIAEGETTGTLGFASVLKPSASGSYTLTATADKGYLFFLVPQGNADGGNVSPSGLSTGGVTSGGFGVPITDTGSVTIGGVAYRAYRVTDQQQSGSITIKVG